MNQTTRKTHSETNYVPTRPSPQQHLLGTSSLSKQSQMREPSDNLAGRSVSQSPVYQRSHHSPHVHHEKTTLQSRSVEPAPGASEDSWFSWFCVQWSGGPVVQPGPHLCQPLLFLGLGPLAFGAPSSSPRPSAAPPKISRLFLLWEVFSWNCGSRPWPTKSVRLGFSGVILCGAVPSRPQYQEDLFSRTTQLGDQSRRAQHTCEVTRVNTSTLKRTARDLRCRTRRGSRATRQPSSKTPHHC